MVFCNYIRKIKDDILWKVTILILIDGFLQYRKFQDLLLWFDVTILILIDGFLQCLLDDFNLSIDNGHNPYFNRWFSAIAIRRNIW